MWADDIVRLCDALGIDHPIVIGESFGGFVAQRYLARHPDHPRKVVPACTAPRFDIDVVAAAFERRGGDAARDAAATSGHLARRRSFPTSSTACPSTALSPAIRTCCPRTIINFEVMSHFLTGEHRTMNLAPGLSAARCPVLVLAGELDPVCPIDMSDEIVAALVNADVTDKRIPNASHDDVGPRGIATIRSFITASAAR